MSSNRKFQGPWHSTVLVRLGRWRARVDEPIAPLVLETWKAGIRTHCSCQDAGAAEGEPVWMKDRIMLGFPTVEHARHWLRIVTVHRKGVRRLYHRMTSSLRHRCRSRWRWEVTAYDAAYDWPTDTVDGPTWLEFRVFLYFPRNDIGIVLRRLREHNTRGPRPPVTRPKSRNSPRARGPRS